MYKINNRWYKIALITVFLFGFVAFFSYEKGWIGGEMSCCHYSVNAQSQEEEEEGNPNHEMDRQACGTRPQGKELHPCVCSKWRKCDGTEPKSCYNFCQKNSCKCVNPCV